MPHYKIPNDPNPHFLSEVDIANGGERALPPGFVHITDEDAAAMLAPPLDQVKATQCALMETAYSDAVSVPISYMGTTFNADNDSRIILNQTLTAAGGTLPAGFQWYDVNNVGVTMTFAQLQGLAASILSRGQPLFVNKQTKKAEINAATSVSAAQAITS